MTTSTQPASQPTDVSQLAQAIESRDAAAVTAWYAEDATLTILDRDHPPANPQVHAGRSAIGGYYQDVCARNIEHEVRDLVSTDDGFAYVEHCRYPDGTAVMCVTVATLAAGRIQRQTASQTWDG